MGTFDFFKFGLMDNFAASIFLMTLLWLYSVTFVDVLLNELSNAILLGDTVL